MLVGVQTYRSYYTAILSNAFLLEHIKTLPGLHLLFNTPTLAGSLSISLVVNWSRKLSRCFCPDIPKKDSLDYTEPNDLSPSAWPPDKKWVDDGCVWSYVLCYCVQKAPAHNTCSTEPFPEASMLEAFSFHRSMKMMTIYLIRSKQERYWEGTRTQKQLMIGEQKSRDTQELPAGWYMFSLWFKNEHMLIRQKDLTGSAANAAILNPFKIIFFILNLVFSVTRILSWYIQNPFDKRNNLVKGWTHSNGKEVTEKTTKMKESVGEMKAECCQEIRSFYLPSSILILSAISLFDNKKTNNF